MKGLDNVELERTRTQVPTTMPSGGGKGGQRGASAPGGTVQGAAFGGEKYGILKFGRFWRIGVCIAGRIQGVRFRCNHKN